MTTTQGFIPNLRYATTRQTEGTIVLRYAPRPVSLCDLGPVSTTGIIGPQRAAPKSLAAIQAEMKQMRELAASVIASLPDEKMVDVVEWANKLSRDVASTRD